MKTSYFSKFSRLSDEEKERYYPIAISTTIPNWYSEYKEHHTFISPKDILPRYLRKEIDWEQYMKEYMALLDRLEEVTNIYEFYSNIEIEDMDILSYKLICPYIGHTPQCDCKCRCNIDQNLARLNFR